MRPPSLPALAPIAILSLAMAGPIIAAEETLPSQWLLGWNEPPPEDRPLQIVHGIPPSRANLEGMRYYQDLGLGGVVANTAFGEYLRSEQNWETLLAGVEACQKLGLIVWLYDEDGYPSGAAGGLVLEDDPAFEALALTYDASSQDPFVVRPAYEHTHASNNFYAARRYANLLDDRACRSFIRQTHQAYFQRLESHFGHTIQAFFTDEPSLVAVNIGQLGEETRKKVRVVDPLDPDVQPLPCVPWAHDLPEQYEKRYGEDLLAVRGRLFTGESDDDRRVRRRFWALVADLTSERFFGSIQEWCKAHGVASSGHTLWEEQVLHHVPIEGNGLAALMRMDIPGLDLLNSDPQAVIHSGWMTAALPSSAAMLSGRRRVMTEVSDFSQKLGGAGPVSLEEMQAVAAWQAAWGVTDFTLYYAPGDREADDTRAYCRYVGRLNSLLKPARLETDTLLYYPIHDLWAEYRPVAEKLTLESQTARARQIVSSFMRLGQTLQRTQTSFTLIDHECLGRATIGDDGRLAIGARRFESLVLPVDVELPAAAAEVVQRFRQAGGNVVRDKQTAVMLSPPPMETVRSTCRIEPANDNIALGRFTRQGRTILLIVNVAPTRYEGRLSTTTGASRWTQADPASGAITTPTTDTRGRVLLRLEPRRAVLLIERP